MTLDEVLSNEELRQRESALAHVDAHFIAATRPGRRLEQVLQEGIEAYQYYGYPAEWRQQEQGGLAGYNPREVVATLGEGSTVALAQAYAWCPAVTGMRSEDTILVGEQDNEVLTAIPRWSGETRSTVRAIVAGWLLPNPSPMNAADRSNSNRLCANGSSSSPTEMHIKPGMSTKTRPRRSERRPENVRDTIRARA